MPKLASRLPCSTLSYSKVRVRLEFLSSPAGWMRLWTQSRLCTTSVFASHMRSLFSICTGGPAHQFSKNGLQQVECFNRRNALMRPGRVASPYRISTVLHLRCENSIIPADRGCLLAAISTAVSFACRTGGGAGAGHDRRDVRAHRRGRRSHHYVSCRPAPGMSVGCLCAAYHKAVMGRNIVQHELNRCKHCASDP